MVFCPYRICTLGAHIDHQNGRINGFAIDRGIHMACERTPDGSVELTSIDFDGTVCFHPRAVPQVRAGDWADHLRGAALVLAEKYELSFGLRGVIEGTLPVGGLSSSAAVIICLLRALCLVNGLRPDPWELIMMAKRAENEYVGVNCGKLDQACEVLSRRDHLLYLDCRDDAYTLIPAPDTMKPYVFAVFFSGLTRSLVHSGYNLRLDECRAAAYSLMAWAGLEYGRFAETRLRDVPPEVYLEYRDRLPAPFRCRADHFFSEMERAEKGAEAWRTGDLETYGQLVFESGRSSVENYQCGCPELIRLYRILTETAGVYGGRFSGAGFKGCCMALIDPDRAEEIEASVTEGYLRSFPALEGRFSVHFCRSAQGVCV